MRCASPPVPRRAAPRSRRVGAECLIGTPDRLASMRGALDGVTIACWMLATVQGDPPTGARRCTVRVWNRF